MKVRYCYANLMQTSFLLISLSAATILSWVILQSWLAKAAYTVHPTGIPWLETQADCEKSGRVWQEGNCWDSEHDPTF